MLKSIRFKQDIRGVFKEGELFEFRPGANIIVGCQGTGKSTMVELFRSVASNTRTRQLFYRSVGWTREKALGLVELTVDPGVKVAACDFERDSMRAIDPLSAQEDDTGSAIFAYMKAKQGSHGEHIIDILDGLLSLSEKVLLVLDEPDMGLSPRSCYELVRKFRKVIEAGQQVIATAHNPILITGSIPEEDGGWDEVLSLEHKSWMKPDAYLHTQLAPRVTKKKRD